MNLLKRSIGFGILFVLVTGTLAHFTYDWSGHLPIVGLFTPVNESTWEHMKLLFFPQLFYSLYMIPKLKKEYPCICSGMLAGNLLGTLMIPVLFYTYTGILGKNYFVLDILTFVCSVFFSFYLAFRLTLSCRARKYSLLLCGLTAVMILYFFLFTYRPPDIGLFALP